MIKPTTRVYRTKTLEGLCIPAVIHNGHYYFTDIEVYENGRVECWNFEDFEHFKKNVEEGWVSTSIPDNEQIRIHGLGNWTITNGQWIFSEKTFIEYALDVVKQLNPTLDNLHHYSPRKINGIIVGDGGSGTLYKEFRKTPNEFSPKKIKGDSVDLFYRTNNIYHLVKVVVYADDKITIDRLEEPFEIDLQKLEALISEGIILSEIPIGANVNIYGLGSFTAKEVSFVESIEDKLAEIKDLQRELKGEPSVIDLCKQAYAEYMHNPTVASKDKLKIAYENIPTHQRMYVGDMDTKDVQVRMILYGKQEIENWSHYAVAKSMGEELPHISIPKTKDEQ